MFLATYTAHCYTPQLSGSTGTQSIILEGCLEHNFSQDREKLAGLKWDGVERSLVACVYIKNEGIQTIFHNDYILQILICPLLLLVIIVNTVGVFHTHAVCPHH